MTTILSKPIFISHASTDALIADKVVDLLSTAMGIVIEETVFCTSLEGLGIPAGMDFKEFIKNEIQNPQVVVLLISQNYLASQFCLAELGASWAMSHRVIPFLIPPTSFADMKAVLAGIQALEIDNPSHWNDALGLFKDVLGINPNPNRWERKRNERIAEISSLLKSQPDPPLVPLAKFNELQSMLEGANAEIKELETTNVRLTQTLNDVKRLKDVHEVLAVENENLPSFEVFEQMTKRIAQKLTKFSRAVQEVLYYHFRGESLPEPHGERTDERWNERWSAVADEYLVFDGDRTIELNYSDPQVNEILDALSKLRTFMQEHPELHELYSATHDHALSFTSRRFWIASFNYVP